jgi:hypothetical protein
VQGTSDRVRFVRRAMRVSLPASHMDPVRTPNVTHVWNVIHMGSIMSLLCKAAIFGTAVFACQVGDMYMDSATSVQQTHTNQF